MSIQQIRARIESILVLMQPYWEFVNCHMVNYLTDNHWSHYIPATMRAEVPDIEHAKRCIETAFWQRNTIDQVEPSDFTAFTQFLKISEQHRLCCFEEIITTLPDLQKILEKECDLQQISIKEFMSKKKRHEVEITAQLVNDLIASYSKKYNERDMFVIDAGDGKGYLSSRLALQYGHKVLGIDANESNTANAIERSMKLQRVWNGLTERAVLENQGIQPPRRGKKQTSKNKAKDTHLILPQVANYKTTAKYITTDINFTELLHAYFPYTVENTKKPVICLTGLHTCGNLASTCLEVFHAEPNCHILCNIGCCYHLLKEAYSGQEFFGNKAIMALQAHTGFPLSQFLKEKKISLGRNARMLAAQSIERTLTAKELPNISLFYRALLEVWICGIDPALRDAVQVGKIRKFQNFEEYVQLCIKKLPFSMSVDNKGQLVELESTYQLERHYLDLFYLIRMSFAPVLETLILLDRLLYLKEHGYENSYLVPVFDAVISPRHFAVIAFKA